MKKILWILLVLVGFVFAGAYLYKKVYAIKRVENITQETPLIGGPFSLVDHKGKVRTDKDYKHKYMLVYFGYSFCPDICPTALRNVSEALEKLGPRAARFQPIFITVDPNRDTVERLQDYLKDYHPSFVALTGHEDQVKAAQKAYRVYAAKAGEKDENYLIDHSSIVYVMGPGNKFLTRFNHATTPEEMLKTLRLIIK